MFHLALGFLDQLGSFKWWQKQGPCCSCRCLWTGMLQKLQRVQLWTHSSLKLEEGTAPKTFPSEKKCSRCTPHWQCLRFKIHTEVVLRVGFISYTLTSYGLLVTLRISFDFNINCPPPSSSTYTSGHKDTLLPGGPLLPRLLLWLLRFAGVRPMAAAGQPGTRSFIMNAASASAASYSCRSFWLIKVPQGSLFHFWLGARALLSFPYYGHMISSARTTDSLSLEGCVRVNLHNSTSHVYRPERN